MVADPDVIAALETVVAREPYNLPLRLHLAGLLLDSARPDESLGHIDAVLAVAPADPLAQRLRRRALSGRGLRLVRDEP